MLQRISPLRRRCGTLTPLMMIALVLMVGAFAIAVDYSFLSAARQELQNGTDAAATAGAQGFVDDRALLNSVMVTQNLVAESRMAAIRFASANLVAGQPLALLANPENHPDGDIVFGSISPGSNVFVPADPSTPLGINAVRIIGRRTQKRGDPVATLISGAFGLPFVDMRTSSIALLDHDVIGFRPNLSVNLPLAPIAILSDPSGNNENSWEYNVVEGNGTPVNGSLLPTITVQMPASGGTPNGLALVIGTTALAAQLVNGIAASDLQGFGGQFVLGSGNELEVAAVSQGSVNYNALARALASLQASSAQRVYPLYLGSDSTPNEPTLSGFVAARVVSVMPINGGGVAFTLQPTVIAVPAAVQGITSASGTPLLTPYIVKVRLVQ